MDDKAKFNIQLTLAGAIVDSLIRQGYVPTEPEHLHAIVDAAGEVVAALIPEQPQEPITSMNVFQEVLRGGVDPPNADSTLDRIKAWCRANTGASEAAKAMLVELATASGIGPNNLVGLAVGSNESRKNLHPRTAFQFRDCVSLIEAVPEFYKDIPELAKLGPKWATVAEQWYELKNRYLDAITPEGHPNTARKIQIFDRILDDTLHAAGS